MKSFYKIYRSPSAGFFSNFFSVLRHTELAHRAQLIPFVDFSEVSTNYRQVSGPLAHVEQWEYFFSQPLGFAPTMIAPGDEIVDCGGKHPSPQEPIDHNVMSRVWQKYFAFNEATSRHLEEQEKRYEVGPRTLGILFRGLDMKTSPLHPLPPTVNQVRQAASSALSSGSFDSILLVTESRSYALLLRDIDGTPVATSSSRKIWMTWQRTRSPRAEHGYLSGLEVLTDAYLLSRCGGLVYSKSNIATASLLFRERPPLVLVEIDNGVNVNWWPLARVYWYLLALVPERFGGLGSAAIKPEPKLKG